MFKKLSVFVASFLAALIFASPSFALSLSSLEKVSADSENIEINTPEPGYNFDANFLAQNEELIYRATVTNDQTFPIKITNITLQNSQYDFFDYSYSGIEINDEIQPNATKDIEIIIRTNDTETSTVSEDYRLTLDYELIKPTPDGGDTEEIDNPETTSDNLSIIIIATISVFAAIFVFTKNKRTRHFAILFALPLTALLFTAPTKADEPSSFTILGKIRFTNTYTVTVNPNGGIYENSTENTVTTRREGQTYHVTEVTREHFDFLGWEVNPGELDANNDIEIHHDTYIKAKWNEKTYTLTIKPNGGKYNDSTENYVESFRPHEFAQISLPTREGYDFTGWTIEDTSESFSGSRLEMVRDITLVANYSIKRLNVTIDPNGGTYNGSTEIYSATVDWGTVIDLTNTSRAEYDLKDWTKNQTGTLSADTQSITITEDTALIANWWSSHFHTVTIIPNGGTYDNKTTASEYSVREGTTYTMLEVTNANGIFNYWHYTNTDTHFAETSFIVTEDISLTAEWLPIVARIERTQKVYPSIMAAHEEAIENDIITLLVDTAEIVTNTKHVTLDLNYHVVTGYLHNTAAGNLTLLNGEFNNYASPIRDTVNPHAAAAINDGTLTLGINDYQDEDNYNKEPLIDHENVHLYGTDYGLIQNNIFNYYDGQIEGTIGLIGGYDDSPWYRTTDSPEHDEYDTVHYYPHVSRITRDEQNAQHVQLANANRAVSRTIVHGAIYYYDLQDNIDTSVITGYDIYAVRDFDASYPITIANNTNIVFDIDGYTVNLGETVTNNGTFTIKDNKPSENKGVLTTSKTTINNGLLNLNGVTVSAITTDTAMHNNNTLRMRNSTLTSSNSATYEARSANEIIDMDDDSYIKSTNASYPALNNKTNFTATSGNFVAVTCAVYNNSGKTFTLTGGHIQANRIAICNYGKVYINGGEVEATNPDISTSVYGIYSYKNSTGTNISSGLINVTNSNAYGTYGVYTSDENRTGPISITGGTINVIDNFNGTNTYGSAFGTQTTYGTITINGSDANINVQTAKKSAYGYSASSGTTILTSGTINVSSINGVASGASVFDYSAGSHKINGNDARIISYSQNNNAYGFAPTDSVNNVPAVNMSAGNISATTGSTSKLGVGINVTKGIVTGGTVYGSSYGFNGNSSATLTIGNTAKPLYNGQEDPDDHQVYAANPIIEGGKTAINTVSAVSFYDGILRGGEAYISNVDKITAIPDGTFRKVTAHTSDDGEDCWLEYDEAYLQLSDGSTYRELGAAYENAQDTDTITVIADNSTQAVLPANTKNITFDLNGHTLNLSQPLRNSSTMTIVDNSTSHNGVINSTASSAVYNNGTMTIASGTINATSCGLTNESKKTLTVSGGQVKSKQIAICNYGKVYVTGGDIIAGGENITSEVDGIKSYNGATGTNMSGGTITATGNRNLYGINVTDHNRVGPINITGGTISVISTNNDSNYANVVGVDNEGAPISLNSNDAPLAVNVQAKKRDASAIRLTLAVSVYISDGNYNVSSIDGNAYGILDYNTTATINHANAVISATSTNGNAYGFSAHENADSANLKMEAGSLSATTQNSSKVGVGVDTITGTITGGTIYGSTHGIHRSRNSTITIGANAKPLYNGQEDPDDHQVYAANPIIEGGQYAIGSATTINFYDGILRSGNLYALNPDTIKAIPDGTYRKITPHTEDAGEDCWLEYDAPYLQIDDGSTYRNLGAAYENVQNGGTITVIADTTTQAVLPTNTKNITFDLNGHTLNYTQPLLNSGTMTITDNSEYHNGAIINTTSTTISNSGTMTVTGGTIRGNSCAITNQANKNFTLAGGTIEANTIGICNYGRVDIVDGTINAGNANATGDIMGIYTYDNSIATNISGGTINVTGKGSTYGIRVSDNNHTAPTKLTGGTINVTNTNESSSYNNIAGALISASATTINGTDFAINVTAKNHNASGLSLSNTSVNFTAGTITVNGDAQVFGVNSYGSRVTFNSDDAIIVATSTNDNAYGYAPNQNTGHTASITMNAGSITATSESASKLGVGVDAHSASIKGGTITGSTYGFNHSIGNAGASLIIGDDAAPIYNGLEDPDTHNINPANPIIEGGKYGVGNASTIEFYDGIVKGGIDAFEEIREVKTIADDSAIYDERISNIDHKYLSTPTNVAKIGTGDCDDVNTQCFTSLQTAVEAANANDTVTLITDNYLFYKLNIPTGQHLTIDLAGCNIITGNPITNNGNLTFINSGAAVTLSYIDTDTFITNKSGATLSIDGLHIQAPYALKNETNATLNLTNTTLDGNVVKGISSTGALTLNHATILSTDAGVSQTTGAFTITDSEIYGANSALTISSATGSISDSTLTVPIDDKVIKTAYQQTSAEVTASNLTINGSVDIVSGNFSLTDSSIAYRYASVNHVIFKNAGTSILDNVSIASSGSNSGANLVSNSNALTLRNGSSLSDIATGGTNHITLNNSGTVIADRVTIDRQFSASDLTNTLISNSGNFTISNSTATISSSNSTLYGVNNSGSFDATNTNITVTANNSTAYGILAQNSASETLIHDGTIKATGKTAYGTWIKESGNITLGEAEAIDSACRGQACADVDTTTPVIEAIGSSNGYAVTIESGNFNFYDGKLIQNQATHPAYQADHVNRATISNVEYWYEPEVFSDGNGHYYYILTYMPQP